MSKKVIKMDATIVNLFYLKRAKANVTDQFQFITEPQSTENAWTKALESILTQRNGRPKPPE